MRLFQNIRVRLTLWYLLVVAVLVSFFGIVAYVNLSRWIYQKTIVPADMTVARVEKAADGNWTTTVADILPELNTKPWEGTAIFATYIRPKDISEVDGRQYVILPHPVGMEGGPMPIDVTGVVSGQSLGRYQTWMYVYFSPANPGKYDVVFTTQDSKTVLLWLGLYRNTLLITGLVTLALAGVLGFFLISRILRPVKAITRTAKEIEENNLGRRLDVRNKDELGELASTLNQMLGRLDAAFVREREFTADASHELRTPLAIAQGEASLALRENRTEKEYKDALESISRQISRMSSLISRLLFLARSDDRLELVKTDVNLRALLAEVASDAQMLCEPKGISLAAELAAPEGPEGEILVKADAVRLRELFLNLVDNAVRYTPSGGSVTISISRAGDFARVAVKDTGVGIPAEHLSNIFKRFYRVDKSRSRTDGGVGLGLAITQRIAEIHGGRIEVQSEVGKGSTFTVFLPTVKH